jgi:zinc transport system substrate-binding protein
MQRIPAALVALALMVATGCAESGRGGSASEGPRVSAAVYPLEFVATEVGGAEVEVVNLSPPGVEPHDLEVSPDQVRSLAQSDLVLFVGGGFQPAVEDIVDDLSGIPVVDGLETQEELLEAEHSHEAEGEEEADHGETDPHFWLDPQRLVPLGELVAAELGDVDPENTQIYKDNSSSLAQALARLDREYEAALEDCERNELIVSHEAFGYLTERYGLEQVGVSGIDPEAEPTPGRLAEVAGLAGERGATTIFFEEQVAPDIAEVLSDEIGAGVDVLDPLEFRPEGDLDYFDVMRANLEAMTAALGCDQP